MVRRSTVKAIVTLTVLAVSVYVFMIFVNGGGLNGIINLFNRSLPQQQRQQQRAPAPAPPPPAPAPKQQSSSSRDEDDDDNGGSGRDTPSEAANVIRERCGHLTGDPRLECERSFVAGNLALSRRTASVMTATRLSIA